MDIDSMKSFLYLNTVAELCRSAVQENISDAGFTENADNVYSSVMEWFIKVCIYIYTSFNTFDGQ